MYMFYKIWLFPIALVGVIISLVLPFNLSSSSPHLNFPSIIPLFDFLSPLSLWYFSPPPLLTFPPSDPNPPQKYLYRMTFYSTKFFCLRESAGIFGLGYLQKGSSVQSERRGTFSVPEAEGISDKKQPQGPSLWQKGNLKDIITKKQRKQDYDQLVESAC